MALPSSPPLLPEQDLPTSPAPPPLASAPTNAGWGPSAAPRKRQLELADGGGPGGWSSDPLFSDASTDGDAGQYEGEQPRRKKLVRGPWWSLRRDSSHSLRRRMAKKERVRNDDSGIWMGSDESQASLDSIVSGQQRLQELAVDDVADEALPSDATVPDPEALAARIVNGCVENGKEQVDLSELGLASLSNAVLQPLHQLIRHAFADFIHPPSEDEFGPLTPSIQLFLSRNQLAELPPELFSLTNITVLSLRNNDLRHLPPSISRLQNLTELNIAGNGIQFLPWELLDMLHSPAQQRQFNIRPNPLLEPCDLSGSSPFRDSRFTIDVRPEHLSRWADTRDVSDGMRERYEAEEGKLSMRGELELRLKLGRMMRTQYQQEASRAGREVKPSKEELIYLASSSVQYFGPDGTPVRQFRAYQSPKSDRSAVLDPCGEAPAVSGGPAVPSLFELALRKLQAGYSLADFLPHLEESGVSASLTSAIRRAAANVEANGNESCSTCGKGLIIARAEWMEYWFHGFSSQQELTPASVLPFLRRACSWVCAKPSEIGDFKC